MAVLLLFCFQHLQFNAPAASWSELASPWMTRQERLLYASLNDHDRLRFRGYFVARRQKEPDNWSATGLSLPCFYAPRTHGDIRDYITYAMGPPKQQFPEGSNRPRWWAYDDLHFHFVTGESGAPVLAEISHETWEAVLQGRILNPEIRYDFRIDSFGDVPLPQDLEEQVVNLDHYWLLPEAAGTRVMVQPPLPPMFLDALKQAGNQDPLMRLELEARTSAGETLKRTAARRISRADPLPPRFTFTLPPGYYQSQLRFWINGVPLGLRASWTVFIPPTHLPRLSTPLLCEAGEPATIEVPDRVGWFMGDSFFPLKHGPRPGEPAEILVSSPDGPVEAMLIFADGHTRELPQAEVAGQLYRFSLPAVETPYEIRLAHRRGNPFAFSGWPHQSMALPVSTRSLLQADTRNYLAWEHIQTTLADGPSYLFCSGFPYLGSRTGSWPWALFNWGETLSLGFQYRDGPYLRQTPIEAFRPANYFEINVSHPFLLVGMHNHEGHMVVPDVKVLDPSGTEIPFETAAMPKLPKLTGLLITENVLRAPLWREIRQPLLNWLRHNSGPQDRLYMAQASVHPLLVAAPTSHKAVFQASLLAGDQLDLGNIPNLNQRQEALWKIYAARLAEVVTYAYGAHAPALRHGLTEKVPKLDIETGQAEFSLYRFLESLTDLGRTHHGPHQLLLITDELNTEPETTHLLLDRLRASGIQVFSLTLPDLARQNFRAEANLSLGSESHDGLKVLPGAVEDHPNMGDLGATMDSALVGKPDALKRLSLLGFKWGNKKGRLKSAALPQIRAAYTQRYSELLASHSAGVSTVADEGMSEIKGFFEDLHGWETRLIHLTIHPDFNPAEVVVVARESNGFPFWAQVPWSDRPSREKP